MLHSQDLSRQSRYGWRRVRPIAGGLVCLWGLAGGSASARQAAPAATVPAPLSVSRLADPDSSAGRITPAPPLPPPAVAGQLLPLPVTRLEDRPRAERLDAGRTFSLRLTNPVPVGELLLQLVRDTPFSVAVAAGVEGSFVGELKDVSLAQALDLVLRPLELDFAVEGTSITVFPRRMETRLFDVNHVSTVRAGRRTSGGEAAAITSTDGADLFVELSEGVRMLLSPSGRFNLDRKPALLQVTDFPDRLDRVGLYVEAVEQRVTRQVEIVGRVIEVELAPGFDAGLDWPAILAQVGGGGPTGRVLDARRVDALVEALRTQGTLRVLASPRVRALNNEPVLMRMASEGAMAAPAAPAGVAAPGPVPGVTLSVTPQIAADGIIQMSIAPRVATRTAGVSQVELREVDTLVRLRSDETVVISGLMQSRDGVTTDLVILLTPRLVVPGVIGPHRP